MTTRTIEPAVLQALASIEWDGNKARMAPLDRKVYVKVNDALTSFGGKWDKKAKAHLFDIDARDAVEAAIESGVYISAADVKQIFGEFETPDDLADRMAGMVTACGLGVLLEPSAGSGQLVKAYKRRHGMPEHILAIEIQAKRRAELESLGCHVVIEDFLQFKRPTPMANRILMNPPFARQADVDHVTHAFSLLATCGTLVAIMSPGWTFRENKKSKEFRALVEANGEYEKLPEDSFRSAGTGVNTVLVTLRKSPGWTFRENKKSKEFRALVLNIGIWLPQSESNQVPTDCAKCGVAIGQCPGERDWLCDQCYAEEIPK